MADLIMTYNAEQVACDFYDWLVQMGYCDVEDEIEDLEDVVRDFQCIRGVRNFLKRKSKLAYHYSSNYT